MLERFQFPKQLCDKYGLAPVDLRGLGRVVVLAGPNGGGKTRFLRALEEHLRSHTQEVQRYRDLEREVARNSENLASESPGMPTQSRSSDATAGHWTGPRDVLRHRKDALRSKKDELSKLEEILDSVSPREPGYQVGWIVYNGRQHDFVRERVRRAAEIAFRGRHPESKVTEQNRTESEATKQVIREVLGTELTEQDTPEGKTQPFIFGRRFNEGELSDGEHRKLDAYLTLAAQAPGPPHRLWFMDEPELNLHPEAAVSLMRRLMQQHGPNAQFWIATHSPSIVAEFGGECLYEVANGSIAYATPKGSLVMEGLLGGQAGRHYLADFLSDAEKYALLRFAAECVLPPKVSDRSDDPQSRQFAGEVAKAATSTYRVLDYASGKARFARALSERLSATNVDYCAFDRDYGDPNPAPSETKRIACQNVKALFPSIDDPASILVPDLTALLPASFDLIVMCNFLHEVPAKEWPLHFGEVYKLLGGDGVLLVMEDQRISVGERPHSGGFLVMTPEELSTVFGVELKAEVKDERLSATRIPKESLDPNRWSPTRFKEAIARVRQRALGEVRKIRSVPSERPWEQGRLEAFFTMLFANASLALEDLQGPAETGGA